MAKAQNSLQAAKMFKLAAEQGIIVVGNPDHADPNWHRGSVGNRDKAIKRDGRPKKNVRRLEGYSGREGVNPFLVPKG